MYERKMMAGGANVKPRKAGDAGGANVKPRTPGDSKAKAKKAKK